MVDNTDEKNSNSIISVLREIAKALTSTKEDMWLKETAEEIRRIKKEIGDDPQITSITEELGEAEEINAKIKAVPFKKENIALFLLSSGLIFLGITNPDLIYQIFKNFHEDYDDVLLIYHFIEWGLFYMWFSSISPIISEDKNAFDEKQREVNHILYRLEKLHPNDETEKGEKAK